LDLKSPASPPGFLFEAGHENVPREKRLASSLTISRFRRHIQQQSPGIANELNGTP
jgi:hypothetical protein